MCCIVHTDSTYYGVVSTRQSLIFCAHYIADTMSYMLWSIPYCLQTPPATKGEIHRTGIIENVEKKYMLQLHLDFFVSSQILNVLLLDFLIVLNASWDNYYWAI